MIDLLLGDSLAMLPTFPVGFFDVTVTSPIYNIGVDYRSGCDDKMPRADYLRWVRLWLGHLLRVTSDEGSLFLNIGGKPTDPWGPFEVALEARAAGWCLQNEIHWVKAISLEMPYTKKLTPLNEGATTVEEGKVILSVGHYKPINSPRFLNDCVETVLHLTKMGTVPIDRLAVGVPFADEANVKRDTRGKNGNVRCRGNAWYVPYPTITNRSKDRPHPASFPPALAEMCFKLHGVSRIRRTLDPFSGLGSTARASARLGLDHVGIELSAEDVIDARKLLEEDQKDFSQPHLGRNV